METKTEEVQASCRSVSNFVSDKDLDPLQQRVVENEIEEVQASRRSVSNCVSDKDLDPLQQDVTATETEEIQASRQSVSSFETDKGLDPLQQDVTEAPHEDFTGTKTEEVQASRRSVTEDATERLNYEAAEAYIIDTALHASRHLMIVAAGDLVLLLQDVMEDNQPRSIPHELKTTIKACLRMCKKYPNLAIELPDEYLALSNWKVFEKAIEGRM